GYDLQPLNIVNIITKSETRELELIPVAAETLQERREDRKESLPDRVEWVKNACENSTEQWLVWCDFNYEADELRRSIPGAVEVRGSDAAETKARASLDFADGKIKTLISKPTIFGFGSNFQLCHNMVFCGLSDSYEQFYQAVRRCWRFGQNKPVNVYVILSEREVNVLENIKRKQKQMDNMQKKMTELMKSVTLSEIKHTTRITEEYKPYMEMALPNF
ncbi:MAG: helicase C-terminal domain-containing protein, partial [Acutalibacteraceae bacterium]|nr:helicase C-terminal domain-containing protein [Acutalibacteraceae bacterium]